jgi:hypothetical protein
VDQTRPKPSVAGGSSEHRDSAISVSRGSIQKISVSEQRHHDRVLTRYMYAGPATMPDRLDVVGRPAHDLAGGMAP